MTVQTALRALPDAARPQWLRVVRKDLERLLHRFEFIFTRMSTATIRNVLSGDGDRFVYVVSALAALNGLLFGFDTGIISGAFLFIQDSFVMSPLVEGIIVSGAMAGAAAGAAVGGQLADRLGRRRLILIAAIVFFVGSFTMLSRRTSPSSSPVGLSTASLSVSRRLSARCTSPKSRRPGFAAGSPPSISSW